MNKNAANSTIHTNTQYDNFYCYSKPAFYITIGFILNSQNPTLTLALVCMLKSVQKLKSVLSVF